RALCWQGRDDEVTRRRGRQHRFDGFEITELADGEHVRTLAQRPPQRDGNIVCVGADLTLTDDRLLVGVEVLHGIFDRDDVGGTVSSASFSESDNSTAGNGAACRRPSIRTWGGVPTLTYRSEPRISIRYWSSSWRSATRTSSKVGGAWFWATPFGTGLHPSGNERWILSAASTTFRPNPAEVGRSGCSGWPARAERHAGEESASGSRS